MIQVELSASEVPIEPGGTAQLTLTVTNGQDHDDHVFLEIEGIDVEWYALPVPALNVASGGSQSARVLFKVPRASESHAGTYPFLVRARGMESGESGVQQASLIIKPFSALQMDLTPKRAVATYARRAHVFDVRVTNLGNSVETLDLYASDPDDGCAYEFETNRITLKPGRSEVVPMRVEPVTQPMLGSSRLFSFVVSARSVEDSYVSANVTGQLDRRALLSPVLAALLLLCILGGGLYALFRPKPVVIGSFTTSAAQITQGEQVTLAWEVSNFSEALIQPYNFEIRTRAGSTVVKPDRDTTYTLVATGGGRQEHRSVLVRVVARPPAPPPRILAFSASRTRIHQGDTITLNWRVGGATTVLLNPLGKSGDPKLWQSQEVQPATTTPYVLAAKGPSGAVVERGVKVEVVPVTESIAEINYFRVKPDSIHTGEKATLSWSTSNATQVEVDNGVGGGKKPKDRFDVSPNQTTIYTLRALDDKGNIRTSQVTLTVKPPEPVQPPENTDTPAGPPNLPATTPGADPRPPH